MTRSDTDRGTHSHIFIRRRVSGGAECAVWVQTSIGEDCFCTLGKMSVVCMCVHERVLVKCVCAWVRVRGCVCVHVRMYVRARARAYVLA